MSKDCNSHCGEVAAERIRYFTGRYMTARDFRDEQSYHRSHRHLHNRMLHGWGVVCGLHVYPHHIPECAKDHVKVDCGMAVDCCGREIVVPGPVVPPPIPWGQMPAAQPTPPADAKENAAREQIPQAEDHEAARADRRWYPLLCLEYDETEIERVPVLYHEGNCDEQRREYSRVAEGYKFCWHWIRAADLAQYYWKIPSGGCPPPPDREQHAGWDQEGSGQEGQGGPEHPGQEHHGHPPVHPCPEDDCYDPRQPVPPKCCLDLRCPPDHCVPLAWIRVPAGEVIRPEHIMTMGRPTLEPPLQSLTHICAINWIHGGVIPRRELERLRRLEVRFDRRLKKPETRPGACGPWGVNPCTFVVQYGGGREDLDFVESTEPPHVEHDCIAVFTIRREGRHDQRPYAYLENHVVFITLKCDFILDCHGVAVDGNHLGGILPSGDGIRGGTFESWFRVVPDHEWDDMQARRRHEARHQEQQA